MKIKPWIYVVAYVFVAWLTTVHIIQSPINPKTKAETVVFGTVFWPFYWFVVSAKMVAEQGED